MKDIKRISSRRKTPWTNRAEATPLQKFIDQCNHSNYAKRHPSIPEAGESEFINSFVPESCRICGNERIIRYGRNATGLIRYQCKKCRKVFTSITGTIFDHRKIPISEWIDFLLAIFSYGSFNLTSQNNRNSINTTKYWLEKLFLVIEDIQKDVVLSGTVYIDETYYSVKESDKEKRPDGKEYRGLSKNKLCIATACDGTHIYCVVEGKAKPSKKGISAALSDHIEPGSKVIHDGDNSHRQLIDELNLISEAHTTKETSGLHNKDNPLGPINTLHSYLKKFLRQHSGFKRERLQDYLNLFALITNPPKEKNERIEKVLKMAFENPKMLRYRD